LLEDGLAKIDLNVFEVTFTISFTLRGHETIFKRKVYTLLDMVGDVGGLYDGLAFLLGFFLNFYNDSHFRGVIMDTLFSENSGESPGPAKPVKGKIK
jgi:hypothetical protein